MRIAVNLRCLLSPRSGVGHYAYNVTAELSKLPRVEEVLGFSSRPIAGIEEAPFKCITHRLPKGVPAIWEQCIFPFDIKMAKADLVFCPAYTGPVQAPAPMVATFHDATHITQAKNHRLRQRILYDTLLPIVARKAAMIITDSQASSRDLVTYMNIAPERIRVVSVGVGPQFRPLAAEAVRAELAKRWPQMAEPYLLFVGTLEPRKNIPTLIRAYHRLCQHGMTIPLVIAGGKGWMYEEIFATVQQLGLQDQVVFTGYVADEDLPMLYNGAAALVYPSLQEGFGLPPAEAMACGIPVITSNTSSLPEVVGDAGLLLDPLDDLALATAIERVLADSALAAGMRQRGIERARRFTWQRSAEETLTVFQEVLGQS